MTSGIEWDEETHPYGHPQNDCERMQSGGDMVGYVLERPVINEPGTHFQYSCANTMLLSAVIKTQTGINADEFTEKYLFEPLGITDYKWETYTGGLSQTDGGLHLRPRDLAKIGLLYLNDGRWDGQQVIPKAWVDESTRAYIPVILNAKYGFQWWMVDTPAGFNNISTYFASGFGGQRIYVYPSLDLVVVFTHEVNAESDLKDDDTFLLRKYILPSLGADDPSSWVIGLWIALLVTSLVVITWDLTRKDDFSISIWLSWVWVTLIFGPIGWIIYKVTTHHLEDLKGLWRGALSASFYSASGNASGYILFLLLVTVIQPQNDLGLLSVLAPYLAGWFIFRSLPLVCWLGKGYINALRHSFLAEIISTNFVLAGMQSMLIFLQFRWFGLGDVNLSDVMFWVMISTSAMVGAVFVFPFNYWMTRRGYMLWPNRMAQSDDDATQDTSKVSTSLRDSWWVLLLSIIFFIVCLGLTLTLIY